MYDELTLSDIRKMEEEIEHRKLVVRPKALEDVKEARAQGDLSENFEYYAAKKFKNQNESRIRYLERMIRTAKVISEESAEDEAGMNNTVTVEFVEDGTVESYKIVTTVGEIPWQTLSAMKVLWAKPYWVKRKGSWPMCR